MNDNVLNERHASMSAVARKRILSAILDSREAFALFPTASIVLDHPGAARQRVVPGNHWKSSDGRVLLFLGRIHPKKGWKRSSKAGVPPALRNRETGTLPLSAPMGGNTRRNSSD